MREHIAYCIPGGVVISNILKGKDIFDCLPEVDPEACDVVPGNILDPFGKGDVRLDDFDHESSQEGPVPVPGGGELQGRPGFIVREDRVKGVVQVEDIEVEPQGIRPERGACGNLSPVGRDGGVKKVVGRVEPGGKVGEPPDGIRADPEPVIGDPAVPFQGSHPDAGAYRESRGQGPEPVDIDVYSGNTPLDACVPIKSRDEFSCFIGVLIDDHEHPPGGTGALSPPFGGPDVRHRIFPVRIGEALHEAGYVFVTNNRGILKRVVDVHWVVPVENNVILLSQGVGVVVCRQVDIGTTGKAEFDLVPVFNPRGAVKLRRPVCTSLVGIGRSPVKSGIPDLGTVRVRHREFCATGAERGGVPIDIDVLHPERVVVLRAVIGSVGLGRIGCRGPVEDVVSHKEDISPNFHVSPVEPGGKRNGFLGRCGKKTTQQQG